MFLIMQNKKAHTNGMSFFYADKFLLPGQVE